MTFFQNQFFSDIPSGDSNITSLSPELRVNLSILFDNILNIGL